MSLFSFPLASEVLRIFPYVLPFLIILLFIFIHKLRLDTFFSNYTFTYLYFLGTEQSEFPYIFISSRNDSNGNGFSYINFKGIKYNLEIGSILCGIYNKNNDNYSGLIYLRREKCAFQSFVNKSFHEDYLNGIDENIHKSIQEFSELATLFHLNWKDIYNRETVTNLTILNSNNPNKSTNKTVEEPKYTKITRNKNNESYNKLVTEVEEKENINKSVNKEPEKDVFEELSKIIGLTSVKKKIIQLKQNIEADEKRKQAGIKTTSQTLHFVFIGNPGTGKTTIARLIARLLKEIGVLKTDNLIEASRSTLVGQYIGETAKIVDQVINKSLGGVLFIDEAYSLTESSGGSGHDFGKEAVTQLLKRIEDDRDNLIVIVAGYEKEMNSFLKSNSGLESRFPHKIVFEDYNAEELTQIFIRLATEQNYIPEDGLEIELTSRFAKILLSWNIARNGYFSNGRYVRNYFEKCLLAHGERIVTEITNNQDIRTLKNRDLVPMVI